MVSQQLTHKTQAVQIPNNRLAKNGSGRERERERAGKERMGGRIHVTEGKEQSGAGG